MDRPTQRLLAALSLYGAIAIMAGLTLDGIFRYAVWVLLCALALKTWIARRLQQ